MKKIIPEQFEYICDRCAAKGAENAFVSFKRENYLSLISRDASNTEFLNKGVDLCHECFDEFKKFMLAPFPREAAE